jgi:ABC-type nitrate/sulfonate/bicarbonate transport system substrate-binding protein
MYAMLADYGSKMRPDDEVVYADLQECVKAFTNAIERATTFAQENHSKHVENLETEAAAVLEAAQDIAVECMSGKFDDANAEPAAMRSELTSLEERVWCFMSAWQCPFA